MFERYTEKARRVIFFARYEASQFGSPTIETEHLLLGLLREDKALASRFLRSAAAIESIRQQIEQHTQKLEKVSTSVDLPLSHESKRVLAYAAEEAERMNHKHIGTPHLLLGLLREDGNFAASLLKERGLKLALAREEVLRSDLDSPETPAQPVRDRARALAELLLAWEDSGGITVANQPTVGTHTPDVAIYLGNAVITDGESLRAGGQVPTPSTAAEEIAHLRSQINTITRLMERAIANHDFVTARDYSSQETELRGLLHRKLEEHRDLGDALNQPTPILCIEIAGRQSLTDLHRRCDDCLSAGVAHVWVLDLNAKRAYTVTASEGLREFKGASLRLTDPVLELELERVFADPS